MMDPYCNNPMIHKASQERTQAKNNNVQQEQHIYEVVGFSEDSKKIQLWQFILQLLLDKRHKKKES